MKDLRLLARLWPFARPDWWCFVIGVLATPAIAALSLAQPYLIKVAIDEHLVPGKAEGLATLAWQYLCTVGAVYLLEATYTIAIAWGGTRTIVRLRGDLYDHALNLKQAFFDRQPAGKLLTRLTSDVESLGDALGAGIVTIVLDALMIAGTLAAMIWLDWRLTALMVGVIVPLMGTLEVLRRQLRKLFIEIREALSAVNAFLAERIDGVEVLQLFRHEAVAIGRFEELNARFRDATQKSNIYDAFMYALVDGIGRVCVALMLWYGAGSLRGTPLDFLLSDAVSVGLLVAFMDYTERLFRPLREASAKIAFIQQATAALEKIFGLFESGTPVEPGSVPLSGVKGHLELCQVSFRYRPDAPDVLKEVSLSVQPGEVVAVVGATGSGKTTLTRLLNKAYDGYRGSIRVDGQELSQLRTEDLRRHVAAVRQDVQLFSEPVRFNVDLGNPAIGPTASEAAAELVHADMVVRRLGWEHLLRERGADVSVGEGQLLTFARTMAHAPELVILDEATASIDSITEGLIQDAIGRILDRKTVIVVAHRLSTIQAADRIVVMDAGRVVEQGTHAELLALGGRYAALVEAGAHATG